MNSLPVRLFHATLFGIILGALVASTIHGIQQRIQGPPEQERIVVIDEDSQAPTAPAASQGTPTPDDLDGDGMLNTWETANSLNPNNPADADSDFDFDGLTAFEEYELSVATNSQYGKPLGTFVVSNIAPPSGFATISSVQLIESARNGISAVYVTGRLSSDTSSKRHLFTYRPSTLLWTRVLPPVSAPANTILSATDVNSNGQVVGYYGSNMGFIWTPASWDPGSGTSDRFYLDPQSTSPTPAIPLRISDTGYLVYSLTLGGPTNAADNGHHPLTLLDNTWSNTTFQDVNDYGEFVGVTFNPMTGENVTFLAVPGMSPFFSALGVSAFQGAGIHTLPDVDFDSIQWELVPNTTPGTYRGAAVDRITQIPIEFYRNEYSSYLSWRFSDGAIYDEVTWGMEQFSEALSSSSPSALNDWGEFAGTFNTDFYTSIHDWEIIDDEVVYEGYWGSEEHAQGVYFFDGLYDVTNFSTQVFGVSNDPQILLGSSKAEYLWSDSVIVPLNKLGFGNPIKSEICDDGLFILQKNNTTLQTAVPSDDADQDGMPDDWEAYHGLDPNLADAHLDSDDDGINNFLEFIYRSNPIGIRNGIDNDGDGMPNPWEVLHGLNPNDSSDAAMDADEDGVKNLQEFKLGTDPNESDSDLDGMADGWEAEYGLDPSDDGSINSRNGSAGDADGDGVPNGDEYSGDGDPSDSDDFPIQLVSIYNYAWGQSHVVNQGYLGSYGLIDWNGVGSGSDFDQLVSPGILSGMIGQGRGDSSFAFPDSPSELVDNVYRTNLTNGSEYEANFWSLTDGSYQGGSVRHIRTWLRAPSVNFERKFKLLKVKSKRIWPIEIIEAPDPEMESVEEVEVTIPANEEYSSYVDRECVPVPQTNCRVDSIVGLSPVEFIPGGVTEVSADDRLSHLVINLGGAGSLDNKALEWRIASGPEGASTFGTSTVANGLSVATLATSNVKGDNYVVEARVVIPGGGEEASDWVTAPAINVVAGEPALITLSASKTEYRSDGTDTSVITATIKDAHGNLVEDGTPVSWMVNQSPTPPFASFDEETTDGVAKAVLVAPLIPENQMVRCLSGMAAGNTTVVVQRVTGSLSGNLNLDISNGQPATISVSAEAADGTPVYWTTSNGDITSQSTIAGGSATATLRPSGGRLGQVVVTATVGDRMFVREGAFTSTSGLAMGADHPVLIAGATSDGVSTPAYAHGIPRQIPYYASTPVRIKGTPGATVNVLAQADKPLDGWALDTVSGGVSPSRGGQASRGMSLSAAVIDNDVYHSGSGSLAFDGSGQASLQDGPDFQFSGQFTASLWVRPSELGLATLIGKTGSWELKQLGDGKVQASVITDTGTHTVVTSSSIPLDRWSEVSLEYRFQRIRVKINGSTEAEQGVTGVLVASTQSVALGAGFQGHLDDLRFRIPEDLSSLANVTGLAVDGSIQLDSNGNAVFTITSSGTASAGASVQIAAKEENDPGNGQASFGSPLDDPEVAEKIVAFADAVHWDAAYDTVMSFVGGDPQTTQGTVAGIAGGMLVVGDVGSCTKNLWRMAGWSETDPNYVELTLGGLGILTTIPEVTGAGAPVDAAVAALKTLAQRFAGNAEAIRFLTVFIEQIKNAVVFSGESFTWAKAKFLQKMVLDVPISSAFKNFLHDDSLINAAVRATEKLGDEAGEAFYQATRQVFETHGVEVSQRFVGVFSLLSEEAFAALKSAPASDLYNALEGLGKVAKNNIAPFAITRVLNNKHLYGSAYKRTHLMEDMGELADVAGLDHLIKMLKINHRNAKGFRYELEGAASLQRSGATIHALSEEVSVVWNDIAEIIASFGSRYGKKTDIDVITIKEEVKTYRQFKATAGAMKSLKQVQAWCEKARKARLNDFGNYSGLEFHLPNDEIPKISKVVKDWLDNNGIPITAIDLTP